MSRVGKKPIPVPDKTKITYKDRVITVQGEKGSLERTIHPNIDLAIADGIINVTMASNDRESRALQGLTRSLVANMLTGVSKGFDRVLEINGIGYRAELKGQSILFNLGYSHPINFALPEGNFGQHREKQRCQTLRNRQGTPGPDGGIDPAAEAP